MSCDSAAWPGGVVCEAAGMVADTRRHTPKTIGERHRDARIMDNLRRGRSRPLQAHVLQRSGIREAANQIDAGLFDARSDAPDERELIERNVRDALVQNVLDLVDERLALFHVGLARLSLEEI